MYPPEFYYTHSARVNVYTHVGEPTYLSVFGNGTVCVRGIMKPHIYIYEGKCAY